MFVYLNLSPWNLILYTRAWAGLTMHEYKRGNLEDEGMDRVDPITINGEKRDVFPVSEESVL